MDQRLYDAARIGDVDALYALRIADPFILNKVCLAPFAETPLHVAALAGQTEFAKEIVRLMPSFARELNRDGFAPMHLASARGDEDLLMELLKLDEDRSLCLQRDNINGQIPLHYAVVRGRIPVIEKLISHCCESLQEVTALGETVLHLAVKNSQSEALTAVLERLKGLECFEKLLNTKDYHGKGKTIVELAQAKKQGQDYQGEGKTIVELAEAAKLAQVLELLKEYQTALTDDDASAKSPGPGNHDEIKQQAPEEQHIEILHPGADTDGKQNEKQESKTKAEGKKRPSNFEMDNLLLVAAVLIATVTFQAAVTPPSTIWKEGANLNARCIFKIYTGFSLEKRRRECPADTYYDFMMINTAGFLSSVILILRVTLLYRYFPLRLLSISIFLLLLNYMVLIIGLSPDFLSAIVVLVVPEVTVLFLFWGFSIIRKPVWKAFSKWLENNAKIKKKIQAQWYMLDAELV